MDAFMPMLLLLILLMSS